MKVLLTALSLLLLVHAAAQNGNVDLTFNPDDVGYGYGHGAWGFASEITCNVLQQDGKVLLGGDFQSIDSLYSRGIARLDTLGNVDPTFNVGTGFNENESYPEVICMVLQPDGKILVGGKFETYNGNSSAGIVRLNSDGSIDPAFTSYMTGWSYSIKLLSDGRILVFGAFGEYAGVPVNGMAVLNSDGTLDPGFNTSLGPNGIVRTIIEQPDGKLILEGLFTSFNGTPTGDVVRLLPDYTLDPTFDAGTGTEGPSARGLTLNPDGSIFVYGAFNSFNGVPSNQLVKLNSDGSVDLSFAISGITLNHVVLVVNRPSGDQIVIGGFEQNGEQYTAFRLLADGTADVSYNTPYMRSFTAQKALVDDSDRLFYFNGNDIFDNTPLLRFQSDGTMDSTYFHASGANDDVTGSIVLDDGKVFLYGRNRLYKGQIVGKLFRIFSDGSLDTTFHNPFATGSSIYQLEQLSDGSCLVGVGALPYIQRIYPDGAIDPGFQLLTLTGAITAPSFKVQPDDKVILYGTFTSYNGVPANRLIRLNPDGSIDPTFVTGTGLSVVPRVFLQPDQKIILCISGSFTYNGVTYNDAIRLNTDGSIDNSFNIGSGYNNQVYEIGFQNGKLILGGTFTSFNGVTANRIVRLNMNGALDNTFLSGSGCDGQVLRFCVQDNDKVIVYGGFDHYNGTSCPGIARLQENGAIDPSIDFGQDFYYGVQSISMLTDQRILLTGSFTEISGVGRNHMAVLDNCEPTHDTVTVTACDAYVWDVNGQTYTITGVFSDTLSTSFGCDSILVLNLTVITGLPLEVNTFSMPSSADTCLGALAITVTGNSDFIAEIDGGNALLHVGYLLVEDLCTGVHSLLTTDVCGDTLSQPFVIPVDSNFVFNNPFIDSIAVDSLGATYTNCDIYYNGIDTAFIDSVFASGDNVTVIWNIIDANGSNYDTTFYTFNNGPGVYYVQLSVFCPAKALGEYFTVTEAVYFDNGSISTAETAALEDTVLTLYPNPVSDVLTIRSNIPLGEMKIYDVNGRVIDQRTLDQYTIFPIAHLDTGVYTFEFFVNRQRILKRVVKL